MPNFKTTVTWPNGKSVPFFSEAADVLEAETIINFILQRDYAWQGTTLSTNEAGKDVGSNAIYFLEGPFVRHKPGLRYE